MAIKEKYAGQGGHRIEAGEHVVRVAEVSQKLSKKGKPMCVIVFETDDDKKISGYYVRELAWHIAALQDCIACAGLPAGSKASDLVGKRLGILVKEGPANEKGQSFMQIVGYGTEKEVQDSRANAAAGITGPTEFAVDDSAVPF